MKEENGLDHSRATLVRTLKLNDLVMLIIGSIIGSGIFFVPSSIVRQLRGSVPLVLLAWLTGGALCLLGALCVAELTAMKPEAGGLYVFIRDCFGRLPAFLYGWTLFFVIGGGTAAALAVAFAENLRRLFDMPPLETKMAAIGLLALLAFLNVCGTRRSADIQNIATVAKVGLLLSISVALLWKAAHGLPIHGFVPQLGPRPGFSDFGLALISTLWAYEGWQYATYTAGEVVNPERNFPRALLIGTVATAAIYVIVNVAYLSVLGAVGVAESGNVAADAMKLTISQNAEIFIVFAIAISVFSGANGVILTNPRVYYAMANDGLFFSKLAEVHPQFRTPAFAIVAGCLWAGILVCTGTFEQLLTYVIFTGWLFYGLAAACLFVYRARVDISLRPYSVPGYPWSPILFLVLAAGLALNTLIRQPWRSLAGLGIVALGVPAFLLWQRAAHSQAAWRSKG
jgi:APA family basic amino acid/polyamine antiporter